MVSDGDNRRDPSPRRDGAELVLVYYVRQFIREGHTSFDSGMAVLLKGIPEGISVINGFGLIMYIPLPSLN